MVAPSTSSAVSLKEYLKRYQSGTDDPKTIKKMKKKKVDKPKSNSMGGVLVVDEDPVWQKPVQIEEEESDSAGEEQPQVDEDIEVKRMKRLEAIRARKPYHAIAEDGSGWVPVSQLSKPDLSPPHQHRSIDLSPPRQRHKRLDTPSPEAREDLSPPRRRLRHGLAEPDDLSPSRRIQNVSSDNLSPPRRKARHDPVEPEPTETVPSRRFRKVYSDDDISPPRRKGRHDLAEPDPAGISPSRRIRKVSSDDLSPPRRRARHDSLEPTDPSPSRRIQKEETDDLSPPRRNRNGQMEMGRVVRNSSADLFPSRRERKEATVVREARPSRTGLISGKEMKEEILKKREEEKSSYASMDPSRSGRDAEPVFRDREGRRIKKEDMLKAKEDEKTKEKILEWGKGLAQKREAEAKVMELELEKDKPFARTRDDPELDKMLKDRVRWGDPMAHLVKRKSTDPVLEDLGDNERMKESGFIIPQNIPSHSWIKRGVDFPPNRYGIKPGRHWDGVDRSNGFEKELFKRQNEKRATQQEAYLWSVSDM